MREALSIDHIKGGGSQHRKKIGSGCSFYYWLKRNRFPPGQKESSMLPDVCLAPCVLIGLCAVAAFFRAVVLKLLAAQATETEKIKDLLEDLESEDSIHYG
jgi:hypothetical protein